MASVIPTHDACRSVEEHRGFQARHPMVSLPRPMLTKADDFPIHQTPEPVAYAGSDRNFYDRYFFNGYTRDGAIFFAAAMGVYPQLNVIDAAFSVIDGGVQHNLHASRILQMERMDTQVGPIRIDVVEPLRRLRLRVDDAERGLRADLLFDARARVIEEPRFTYRVGPRTLMDYTRLTQNGVYEGWIEVRGTRIEVRRDAVLGTRDRSWGVRPVGAPDSQPVAPPQIPQFYWLWAPMNYDDGISLYHDNADATGASWNTRGVLAGLGDAAPQHFDDVASALTFRSGTRRVAAAHITFRSAAGPIAIDIVPQFHFYMPGIGYMHPEWGHGFFKGELAVGYDSYDLGSVDDNMPGLLHIQAFSSSTLTLADGTTKAGAGVLEQLLIGPHAPSGFTSLFDPAP